MFVHVCHVNFFYFSLSVIVVWLCCLYAHFDIKIMHVDSILTYIFENKYRAKSTPKFDMSTHTNAILKTTYNELRPTTILFKLPRHHP